MRKPSPAWMRRLTALVLCVSGLGCHSRGPSYIPTEPERLEMLKLMLPCELKVQPFTQVKSFDKDEIPDGILAVVQPLDRFGDPVKAAGLFYFELWTYVDGSQERKGERLAFWDRTIGTGEEIKLYWTRAQMYEFQLAWTQGAAEVQPGRKYILSATYRTAWDETIHDEYVLDFRLPPELTARPAAATPRRADGTPASILKEK